MTVNEDSELGKAITQLMTSLNRDHQSRSSLTYSMERLAESVEEMAGGGESIGVAATGRDLVVQVVAPIICYYMGFR